MRVIWDENKNEINKAKHGVSFETASLVFVDEFRIELYDAEHSKEGEDRWQIIGNADGAILFVVETELTGEIIRIISARAATKAEKEAYYGN